MGVKSSLEQMKKSDLLILDECDWHAFDDLCDLPRSIFGVFAMSATDVGVKEGNEELRLK